MQVLYLTAATICGKMSTLERMTKSSYSHSMESHFIIPFSVCQWNLKIFPRLGPRFFIFQTDARRPAFYTPCRGVHCSSGTPMLRIRIGFRQIRRTSRRGRGGSPLRPQANGTISTDSNRSGTKRPRCLSAAGVQHYYIINYSTL